MIVKNFMIDYIVALELVAGLVEFAWVTQVEFEMKFSWVKGRGQSYSRDFSS